MTSHFSTLWYHGGVRGLLLSWINDFLSGRTQLSSSMDSFYSHPTPGQYQSISKVVFSRATSAPAHITTILFFEECTSR